MYQRFAASMPQTPLDLLGCQSTLAVLEISTGPACRSHNQVSLFVGRPALGLLVAFLHLPPIRRFQRCALRGTRGIISGLAVAALRQIKFFRFPLTLCIFEILFIHLQNTVSLLQGYVLFLS